jgi:hypothetical protein
MDIPALSMAMAQNQILSEVGVAMLSKNLDVMQESGEALASSIGAVSELSVNPDVGANIDIRV